MKNNRLRFMILSISLLLCSGLLTGCQLAKKAYQTAQNADELYGIFVTIGYHDLPADEQILNYQNLSGNDTDWFSEDDFNALYNNEIDGMVYRDGTAEFDGINGYYMGITEELDAQGLPCATGIVAPGFQSVHSSINISDTLNEQSCEATFTISTKLNDVIFMNPVYKKDDGSYYLLINQNGYSTSGLSVGPALSVTLDSSKSSTIDHTTTIKRNSFKVNVQVVDETTKTFIKEMNENDELIKTSEYDFSGSGQLLVNSDTKYVIFEEHLINASKGEYIKRSVYDLDKQKNNDLNDKPTCAYTKENGVVEVKYLEFVYE